MSGMRDITSKQQPKNVTKSEDYYRVDFLWKAADVSAVFRILKGKKTAKFDQKYCKYSFPCWIYGPKDIENLG